VQDRRLDEQLDEPLAAVLLPQLGQRGELVLLEALGLGLLGGGTGALAGFVLGVVMLSVPAGPLALASVVAGVGGVMAAALASLLPVSQIKRFAAPGVLAAE